MNVLCLTDEVVPVGCMMINNVAQLRPLIQSNVYCLPHAPTLADLDFDEDIDGETLLHPHRIICCICFSSVN